jgi:hypothetical protein
LAEGQLLVGSVDGTAGPSATAFSAKGELESPLTDSAAGALSDHFRPGRRQLNGIDPATKNDHRSGGEFDFAKLYQKVGDATGLP